MYIYSIYIYIHIYIYIYKWFRPSERRAGPPPRGACGTLGRARPRPPKLARARRCRYVTDIASGVDGCRTRERGRRRVSKFRRRTPLRRVGQPRASAPPGGCELPHACDESNLEACCSAPNLSLPHGDARETETLPLPADINPRLTSCLFPRKDSVDLRLPCFD